MVIEANLHAGEYVIARDQINKFLVSKGGHVSSSASVKVDDLFTVFPEWAEVYGETDEEKAQFARTIAKAGEYARLTDAYNDARNGFEFAGSLASGEWVEAPQDGETIFDGKADVIETPNKVTRLVEDEKEDK